MKYQALPVALFSAFAAAFLGTSFSSQAIELNSVNARIDFGVSSLITKTITDHTQPPDGYSNIRTSPLVGFAINKQISAYSLLGTKIEFQKVSKDILTTFRAIDYRYMLNDEWQLGAFIGAAKYDFRSPAYGYTTGFGAFYKSKAWDHWSIGLEVQFMDKLARDKIHPDDENSGPGPDTFTNMLGLAYTISYNF